MSLPSHLDTCRVDEACRSPENFGVHTACRKARDRDVWHQVDATATVATLHHGVRQYRSKKILDSRLHSVSGGFRLEPGGQAPKSCPAPNL